MLYVLKLFHFYPANPQWSSGKRSILDHLGCGFESYRLSHQFYFLSNWRDLHFHNHFQLEISSKAPCKRTQHCWPTNPNIVGCYMLRPFAHPVACCCAKFETGLLFRDRRSVVQQCWIRLHSSSNIVGATHAHCAWFTNTYGLYPSQDALQVPTLLGVVASVCTPLPTRTQQLPKMLAQQCWELLRTFTRSLSVI